MNAFCDLSCYLSVYVSHLGHWDSYQNQDPGRQILLSRSPPGVPGTWGGNLWTYRPRSFAWAHLAESTQQEPLGDIWVTHVIASSMDTAVSRSHKVSGREQNKTKKPAVLFAVFPGSMIRPDVGNFLWMDHNPTYFKEPTFLEMAER